MTPSQLSAASFDAYPALAQAFATEHLALLQRLPLAICPSFLQQIRGLDTSFPAERENLQHQCDALMRLPADQYALLTRPLLTLSLPLSLQTINWVDSPAVFITGLTAHLWSSGQMPAFRTATGTLFEAIPASQDASHRLVLVLLGADAKVENDRILRKLRKHGVFLQQLQQESVWHDLQTAFAQHAATATRPYANWYIDSGALQQKTFAVPPGVVATSYAALSPLRERVLQRMQATISSGSGGAEQMRDVLAGTSHTDVGAQQITGDAVLQRFYTELFTQSSGPQIFSTSFVQWTGRELARRAQPHTLLLRYGARQQHHDLNELFADAQSTRLDPQGSLRDAEMGAYYNWIEMNRISAPGKLTFAAVVEGHPFAVIIGRGTTAGALCPTPMTLQQALQNFG